MIKKTFLILMTGLVILTLSACNSGTNTKDNKDEATTTNGNTDNPNVGKLAGELENATEVSYTMYFESLDKETNETSTYTYSFAHTANKQAFKTEQEDGFMTIVVDSEFVYWVSNSDGAKTVTKMVNDDPTSYESLMMNLSFLTAYTNYDYEKKTENVKVGNINTTCYEYKYYSNYFYKYYLDSNDLLVKLEWEGQYDRDIIEIRDFKTSNIDMSLFTIPTEADGYTVYDWTTF